MKLSIPQEPKTIKEEMKRTHDLLRATPNINWEPMVVWYRNQLPKYFWDHWKTELGPVGFTWQKFMRLMHYRTDNILLWYRGALSWPKFVETVIELINGPLGIVIKKEK